jgi:hypothetical protein
MNDLQLFLAQRILLTLAYTEQFNFPLNKKELYSRLLVPHFVKLKLFNLVLDLLLQQKLIILFDNYFFVHGLNSKIMKKYVDTREEREQISQVKWNELGDFVSFARHIPFITGIAITGSLAVNNTIKDDDIDFMIVTSPNRLWITRLIIIVYASIKGKRRSFAKEESNSFCFNLWVEESDMQLPINSRSVYEAYEVVQAVWLVSKNNVASRFRNLNSWTNKKVNVNKYDFKDIETGSDWSKNFFILSILISLINQFSFYFQYLYMKPHMTREKVSKSHAFFHPRDTKAVIFKKWKTTLLRLV